MSRKPNQNLPNEELRAAIFQRLDGNLNQIKAGTPVLPIYDEVPEDFRDYDFVLLDDLNVTPLGEGHGHYTCELIIRVHSTYNGYKELSNELNQLNRYLSSQLRTMTNFTDASQGGEFLAVSEVRKNDEQGNIVRVGEYRRRWIIADNRL